jgi:hypothetical protein
VKRDYLEGTDWVVFNDRINDVLDRLNVNAYAASAFCVIRRGRLRRLDYFQGRRGNEWARVGRYYENYCGQVAPPSDYEDGTPGLYQWENKKEKD